ncbi:MAG TPA: hypothetical protein PLB55_24485 [Prosthecobacter sp.]|nr:hypothetical protein [Prosthecobacter sp.]
MLQQAGEAAAGVRRLNFQTVKTPLQKPALIAPVVEKNHQQSEQKYNQRDAVLNGLQSFQWKASLK